MERGGTSATTPTTIAYEVRDLVKEDAKRFEFFYKITIVFLLLISGIVEAYIPPFFTVFFSLFMLHESSNEPVNSNGDRLSYQYLDIFTGFMTGTVIMMGSSIATLQVNHTFPYDSLSALCGFCFGSYLGGALMAVPTRSIRTRPLAKLQYCLAGVALSLLLGIILLHSVGSSTTAGRCAVAFVLAVGMGTQMSGQVGLNVPDLTSPLATGSIFFFPPLLLFTKYQRH